MVEIRCIKDIREKINIDEIEYKLLIDVIQMTALFEVEFGESEINKVVILDTDEEYEDPHPYPEVVDTVGSYNKKVYIVSDSGEGVVIYRKVGLMGA